MEGILDNVHQTILRYHLKENDLLAGVNIAGFEKIAETMILQGIL